MLNLAYINNYLFLFFFLKNRAYRHYVYYGYYVCEYMMEFGRYIKDPELVSIYSLLGWMHNCIL